MEDAGCVEGQENNSRLINLTRLVEETVLLLDEPVDDWWLALAKELGLIDFTAVLAIVIASYDEAKRKALKDDAYKIKPSPDDSEDDTFLIGLLRAVILEPELYLTMVYKDFDNLPMAELEVFAESLLESKQGHAAMNRRDIGVRAMAGC